MTIGWVAQVCEFAALIMSGGLILTFTEILRRFRFFIGRNTCLV